jgi:hypothetical protein
MDKLLALAILALVALAMASMTHVDALAAIVHILGGK